MKRTYWIGGVGLVLLFLLAFYGFRLQIQIGDGTMELYLNAMKPQLEELLRVIQNK